MDGGSSTITQVEEAQGQPNVVPPKEAFALHTERHCEESIRLRSGQAPRRGNLAHSALIP